MGEQVDIPYNKNNRLDKINFEKLFNELYPALCRCAIQFVRIPEIAEDIVQEQFVDLWEKRESLIIHTSLKAYLYKSVKNKSIDYLRSKFAKIQFVQEEFSHNLREESNPLKIMEEQELDSAITEAIEELPEKCYTVFSLSRFGDLTNRQIAEELRISEKTVENQITIAIKKIRLSIESYLHQ
jgi:RNA polymerase sigma-70 factor, ECF subfamily